MLLGDAKTLPKSSTLVTYRQTTEGQTGERLIPGQRNVVT